MRLLKINPKINTLNCAPEIINGLVAIFSLKKLSVAVSGYMKLACFYWSIPIFVTQQYLYKLYNKLLKKKEIASCCLQWQRVIKVA